MPLEQAVHGVKLHDCIPDPSSGEGLLQALRHLGSLRLQMLIAGVPAVLVLSSVGFKVTRLC